MLPIDKLLRVSVVIPAYNRPGELARLLDALSCQSLPPTEFEVIICDDGSTDDLLEVVSLAAAKGGPRLVYLRQKNQGPGPSRQLGLAHALSAVVVNTDSDCLPRPGWLAAWAKAFDDPDVGLAGGPIDYRDARHLSGRCIGFVMASRLGGGGGINPRKSLGLTYHPCSGNLAARRILLLETGGFPLVKYNEDTELSHRFQLQGISPWFVPEASVLHDERTSFPRLFIENYFKGSCRVRGQSLDELAAAMPAGLVLALAASLAVPWLGQVAIFVIGPLMLYALALCILAVQGGLALTSFSAAVAIPFYTLVMHLGYGLGTLAARIGFSPPHPIAQPVDWESVRTRADVRVVFPQAGEPPGGSRVDRAAPLADEGGTDVVTAVTFAVVLPVYNESRAIRHTVDALETFSRSHPRFAFVIVDDGSTDGTRAFLEERITAISSIAIRLITHDSNRGKAKAVRTGLAHCHAAFGAKLVGFLDGDLAYELRYLLDLEQSLATDDVAIGVRSRSNVFASADWRLVLGRTFNTLVRRILSLAHHDTQAGLKGFRAEAAEMLFARQRLANMAFDAELLFLARRLGLSVAEIPVQVGPGHAYKLSIPKLIHWSAQMLAGVLWVRTHDLLGHYLSRDPAQLRRRRIRHRSRVQPGCLRSGSVPRLRGGSGHLA